ncbi:MAG: glycosyltransferase family 4 protein [Anaerolineaceae bacterium]|nr:glycosyltransferase family 4 protein [Anaerolineaceae bacterium]
MKIGLIHYAAPPVVGGVETVLARQAVQLTKAGHQVRILAGRGETWDGRIPVDVLPKIDSRYPAILKMKGSLDNGEIPDQFNHFVEQVQKEIQRASAGMDWLIAHNVASLAKNLALTAALYNISQQPNAPRIILWHHDLAWTTPRYHDELHPGYPWDLLRTAWPGVKQVVVSQARQQELSELMKLDLNEISVIPAGLDMSDFLGLDSQAMEFYNDLHLADAAPILLAPVRLTRRKNLELAVNTLAKLRLKLPQAVLIITGPPGAHNPTNQEYLENLVRLRSELGLVGAVHLLGEIVPEGLPGTTVAEFYRLADALLLTSREEGFGIPILEAGLSRMPVFCTDLPPLSALAGNCATYFSPDDNPIYIAKLIAKKLTNDPSYQLRTRVRQEYTWDAIYRKMIAPLLEF